MVPPNYFSNLLGEAIGESPLPAITTPIHDVCVQAAATTTGTSGTMGATNTESVADGVNDDEASLQLNAPYVGMRFDTMLEAKAHYNTYAAIKGFLSNRTRQGDVRTRDCWTNNNLRATNLGGQEMMMVCMISKLLWALYQTLSLLTK